MTVRALVIDDDARKQAARIIEYAEKFLYTPGSTKAPGEDPNHIGMFNSYRVVFSITWLNGAQHRHMTVSVPDSKLPNPVAVFALAYLFGFTGWNERMGERPPAGWTVGPHKTENCVVVVQRRSA